MSVQPGDVDKIELRPLLVVEDPLPEFGARYIVLSKIGEGNMGSVFKVLDTELDATFAIKVLKADAIQDQVTLRRFEQESEALSGLTHPNVVALYGHGQTEGGSPYFVMDLVDGETLAQRLQDHGFLSTPQALELFIQLCDALENVHNMQIVHRDLKPSNILLEKKEHGLELAKIADFGISKLVSSNPGSTLTETGAIIGTPHYMSPEQCLGDPLDARSDIYSLGCLMYECLSGKPPFAGTNGVQVVLKHLKDAPKPLEANQRIDVPPELAAVVMRCLSKEPSLRYKSMAQLRNDLELLRDGGHPCLPEDQRLPTKTRRAVASVIDFSVVFVLALAVLHLFHAPINSAVLIHISGSIATLLLICSMAILGTATALWLLLAAVTCMAGHNPEFWLWACLPVALLTDMSYHAFLEATFGATAGQFLCRLSVRDGAKRLTLLQGVLRYLARQLWFFGWVNESSKLHESRLESLSIAEKGSVIHRWLQKTGNSMTAHVFVVKSCLAAKQLPHDVWCRGRVVFRNSKLVQEERLPPISDIQHDLMGVKKRFRPALIWFALVLLFAIPNLVHAIRKSQMSEIAFAILIPLMLTLWSWPLVIEYLRLEKLKKRALAHRKASIEKGRS